MDKDDANYDYRKNNKDLKEVIIRHSFKPVPAAEIMRFKAEFDRLFPPFVIRKKLEERNKNLSGKLTVVEWNDDGMSIIHQIECNVDINITQRNAQEIHIVAKPTVVYYKINVDWSNDIEGGKCFLLLDLLKRHRAEGQEEEDNDDDDNDDDEDDDNDGDDNDEEVLIHGVKTWSINE